MWVDRGPIGSWDLAEVRLGLVAAVGVDGVVLASFQPGFPFAASRRHEVLDKQEDIDRFARSSKYIKTNIEVFVRPLKGRVICVVWFRSNLVPADNAITSGGRSRGDNGFAEYSSSVQLLCVAETGSGVDPSVRSNPITCPRRLVASIHRDRFLSRAQQRPSVRPSVRRVRPPRQRQRRKDTASVLCPDALCPRNVAMCVVYCYRLSDCTARRSGGVLQENLFNASAAHACVGISTEVFITLAFYCVH